MNFGITLLGFVMIVGAVLLMFSAAATAPYGYNDTYHTPQSAVTNQTQGILINGTAGVGALGGGAAMLFAAFGIFIMAVGLISGVRRQQKSLR